MMSSHSGKDFKKLLVLAKSDYGGIGDEFDWLFQLGKVSTLVQLICHYVDSDNVLEEDEIESYLEWTANNIFEDTHIPGDHLDAFLGDCENSSKLSAETAALETLIDCLKKRTQQLKSLLGPTQEESTRRQQKYEKALQRFKEAEKGCSTLSRRLSDSYSKLVQALEQSALTLHCDTNGNVKHQYLAHYPLGESRQYRKLSKNAVKLSIANLAHELASTHETGVADNNFSLKDVKSNQSKEFKLIIGDGEIFYEDMCKKIDFFVEKLVENNVKLILLKIDQESIMVSNGVLKKILQKLSHGNGTPSFGLELETVQAFDLNCYKKIEAALRETELDNIVARVMNVFFEECKSAEARLDLKIARLREIVSVVQEQNDLACLAGILLQLDTIKVKNMEELWHCYILSLTNTADQLTRKPKQTERTFLLKNESSSASRVLSPHRKSPECFLSGLRDLISQRNRDSTVKQGEILSSIHLLLIFLTEKKQITNKLEEYVIFGATKKPVIIDYKYLARIQEHKEWYQTNCEELLNAHVAVKKMEIIRTQNPGLWTRRLIWVPFLNDNVERLEAILRGDFSTPEMKYKQVSSKKKARQVVPTEN